MKKVRSLFVLIAAVAAPFSFAQEQVENDSTFNSLDYYFGRIVLGLGGGFEQQVSGKKYGARGFASSPFVFSNIGSRMSVSFSNNTSWTEFDDSSRAQSGFDKNALQTNLIQFRYRLADELLLEAQSNFSHSERLDVLDRGSEYGSENDTRAYRLAVSYYSQGGRVRLTPSQLAFQYYAFPRPAVEMATYAVRFLTPGQFMLNVRGDYRRFRTETESADIPNGYFQSGKFQDRNFTLPELNFIYAWKRRMTFSLAVRAIIDESESTTRISGQEQSFRNDAHQITLAPQLLYFSAENLLHHVSAQLAAHDSKSTSSDQYAGNGTYQVEGEFHSNIWRYDYSLHLLSAISPPALSAFLADWNHDFGNRLPPGVLHLSLQASAAASRFENNRSSDNQLEFLINEETSRNYTGSAQGHYGLTNGIELGTQLAYNWRKDDRWDFEPSPRRRIQKQKQWLGNFTLRFANYRFAERYRARFGWEQLREYDRLYGPLLLRGMLSGSLAVVYSDYASDVNEAYDAGFGHDSWQTQAQARWGICDNLELRTTGLLAKFSDISETSKQFQIALAWQPWNSIRLQARRSENFPEYPAGIYIPNDVVWSFEIMSLF